MHSLDKIRDALPKLCRKLGIVRVDVFGSFARNEATEFSDLDLLIEFDEEFDAPLCNRFFDFLTEIEAIFGNRVDVLTDESIQNPVLRRAIERDRIRIYG